MLTVEVQVQPQDKALQDTIQTFNDVCNYLSEIAYSEKLFHWLPLQRRAYHEVRSRFGLTAAQTVVAIRKVAYAYKNKARRKTKATFVPLGAMPLYCHRYKRDGTVLIYGKRYPFQSREGIELSSKHQAWLIFRDGKYFIHQVIEAPEPTPYEPQGFLGCDLGIVNILTDSDGRVYAGNHLNSLRKRHARLRAKLQTKGTKAAKRLLKKRSRREARFARWVNHNISKKVVLSAHDTLRGIALENLQGIRERITVRKGPRRLHHSWAFQQLRGFIEYKARLNGVPLVAIDPRNTSRTCPVCGVIDKANRKSQSEFSCTSCGHSANADYIAAVNIGRAAGNQPYVAVLNHCAERQATNLLDVKG